MTELNSQIDLINYKNSILNKIRTVQLNAFVGKYGKII